MPLHRAAKEREAAPEPCTPTCPPFVAWGTVLPEMAFRDRQPHPSSQEPLVPGAAAVAEAQPGFPLAASAQRAPSQTLLRAPNGTHHYTFTSLYTHLHSSPRARVTSFPGAFPASCTTGPTRSWEA